MILGTLRCSNKILCVLFVLATMYSQAQGPSWKWAKRAGSFSDFPISSSLGTERITDVKTDAVGNVYASAIMYADPAFQNGQIFGDPTPAGFGLSDAYLIKYSACGKTLWVRRMGGNGYDEARSLVLDKTGKNVMVLGVSANGWGTKYFGDGTHDTTAIYSTNIQFMARFDTSGKFKEVKEYSYGSTKMFRTSTNDYLITDGWTAAKINTLGIVVNTYTYAIPAPYLPEIYGVTLDKADNVYITGRFDNTVVISPSTTLLPVASTVIANSYAPNAIATKFSPNGSLLWYKRGYNASFDALLSCTIDTSGSKLAVGGACWNGSTLFGYQVNSNVNNSSPLFLLLDASSGNLLSARTATRDYQAFITPTYTDRDNNFICVGSINGYLAFNATTYSATGQPGDHQSCIGKFTSTGNFASINILPQLGSYAYEQVNGLAQSEQGNIYIGGMFGGTLDSMGTAVGIIGGVEDGYVAKYGFACGSPLSSLTPYSPTQLSAVAQPSSNNFVNWIDNANYETGFELWAQVGVSATYSLIATLPANTTTYTHSGVLPNTQYCYKARAINATGPSVFTNIACVTTADNTGIAQYERQLAALIYPNPSKGVVYVQLPGITGKAQITVMNSLGQVLDETTAELGNSPYPLTIGTAKGLYLLSIRASGQSTTRKIVVE